MTTVTEAFTDVTGTKLNSHDSAWQLGNAVDTDFVIDTNACKTPFSRGITLWEHRSETFANDQWAQGTITQVGSAAQAMGVAVRASNGTAYTFYHDPGQWILYCTLSYALQPILASGSRTLVVSDVLYLEAIGTTLTAKINGVALTPVSDANIGSGSPGVSGYGGAASGTATFLDTWTGSDVFSTGTPVDLMYPTKRRIVVDKFISRS